MMLLDEPMAGMGHEDIDRIVALIRRVSANRTVLMVEHNLQVVERPLRPHHRADPRTRAGGGRLRDGVGEPRGEERLSRGSRMAEAQLKVAAACRPGTAKSHILHGVDFEVRPGEVVTLLGRNGAGKTTTLKSIMGMVGKRSGSANFDGRETIGLTSDRIARLGVALCPEERGIFQLSVRGESDAAAARRADRRSDLERIFTLFPNLKERLASGGGKLSGGEQQMLAIARILRTGARFLMLDEPTEGLAPVIIQQIGRTIREIKSAGFTILLVEQNFRFAATLADRFYVMEHGKIIDAFAAADLAANMDKLHDYLGV